MVSCVHEFDGGCCLSFGKKTFNNGHDGSDVSSCSSCSLDDCSCFSL